MRAGKKTLLAKELQKTLLYSDIFDYPLTGDQLYEYAGVPLTRKDFLTIAKTLPHKIVGSTIYYFLRRKDKNIWLRIKREKVSLKKMEKVKQVANVLSIIPTIQFLGVSGSLALMNADTKSDSDFFIICSKNTVWLTRLLVYYFLHLLGLKRNEKNNKNAICANMFIDETALQFSLKKRNLYTAHEIIQLIPIFNRNRTYERFLIANKWIEKYFPNKLFPKIQKKQNISLWSFLLPVEYVVRKLQIFYMRHKKTRETTTPTVIAFHPIDYERIILGLYEKRRKQYGV